jgi:hypothetical protein
LSRTPIRAHRLAPPFAAACALAGLLAWARQPAPQAAPPHITFTDICARMPISYRSNNNFTGRKYFPQPMCGGVAIFDYDRDGLEDIYFTNGARLPELKKVDSSYYHLLLHNKGGSAFEDVTAKAGLEARDLDFSFGVAAGDYDNDGYPDLFIANAGPNALYHNNGNGTFTNVVAGSGLDAKPADTLSVQGAWLDYDNDGRLDLILSNYTFWTPEKDIRCVSQDTELYCSPRLYQPVPHRLYHNLGDGKFADVTAEAGFAKALGKGMGIGIADFNRDGWVDIFVANDTERNFLYLNQKNGTFREAGILLGVAYNDDGAIVSAMGCDVKDFDNDGWPDVFYNNLMTQIHGLFRNLKGSGFVYASPSQKVERYSRTFSGWSNGFIDYDNDGWKDIFSANGSVDYIGSNAEQNDTMLRNLGGKEFFDISQELGPDFLVKGYKRGSAFGDLNSDGFLDIVVTALNAKPRILLSSGGNGHHWLAIETVGRKSNRDGIGAEIKVTTTSGRTLYNHVTTSVGFMSSSSKRVHFGLGQESSVKSVEIRWPSGIVQLLENVKPDRLLRVEEPAVQ